jgi:hypothetical protein
MRFAGLAQGLRLRAVERCSKAPASSCVPNWKPMAGSFGSLAPRHLLALALAHLHEAHEGEDRRAGWSASE